MTRWFTDNAVTLRKLPDLCLDHGCSSGVPGRIIAFIASRAELRAALVRVGLPTADLDAEVAAEIRQQLPPGLADWVLMNLWCSSAA